MEKLLPYTDFQEKQKYLESGCGNGAVCKYLAQKNKLNVTGTNIDEEMIRIAGERRESIADLAFLENGRNKPLFQER